jgi:hypothetical protein
MIQTNRLTEKLFIYEIASSGSTIGAVVETLTLVNTIYASLLNQRGDTNYTKLPGAVYNDQISFYCRYLNLSNKKKYRVEYQSKMYYVLEINTVGRNEATIIRCSNTQ